MKQARPLFFTSIVNVLCITAGFSMTIHYMNESNRILKQANHRITMLEASVRTGSPAEDNNGSLAFEQRLQRTEQAIDRLQQAQRRVSEAIIKLGEGNNLMSINNTETELNSLDEDKEDQVLPQEADFNTQQPDPGWSAETTLWIEDHVNKELFNNTDLLDLECRETVCRMTTEHKDLASYSLFNLEFPVLVSGQFQRISMEQEEMADGGVRTVMYLDAAYSSAQQDEGS